MGEWEEWLTFAETLEIQGKQTLTVTVLWHPCCRRESLTSAKISGWTLRKSRRSTYFFISVMAFTYVHTLFDILPSQGRGVGWSWILFPRVWAGGIEWLPTNKVQKGEIKFISDTVLMKWQGRMQWVLSVPMSCIRCHAMRKRHCPFPQCPWPLSIYRKTVD